jgi:hypothetical protein
MKRWARLFWVGCILAGLVAIGSLIVERSYAGRAQLIQRVEVDTAAAGLFGESTPTPIGSPQMMIVDDPKAFMPGNPSPKQVNEAYLREHDIYPLQLKTVSFVAGATRMAGGIVMVLTGLIAWFLGRRAV